MTNENQEYLKEETGPSKETNGWNWAGDQSWLWGIVLVVGGALLLLQNFTTLRFLNTGNWWAIFILVPGLSNLLQAWRSIQQDGRLTPRNRSNAFWGVALTVVALTFFLNISWSLMMPILLIAGGTFLLLTSRSG